jgi:SLT domain-containing protein
VSAPGAGEAVSWVDVAASAAGIKAQMDALGQQAAQAFAQRFSAESSRALTSSMGAALERGLAGASPAAAGARHAQEYAGGFRQALASVAAAGLVPRQALTAGTGDTAAAGASHGQAFTGAFGQKVQQEIPALTTQMFSRGEAGAINAGARHAASFVQGFSPAFQALWSGGNVAQWLGRGEGEVAGAGARHALAYTGSFRDILSSRFGASLIARSQAAWNESYISEGERHAQSYGGALEGGITATMDRIGRNLVSQDIAGMAGKWGEVGAASAQAMGSGFSGTIASLASTFLPPSLRPAIRSFFGAAGKDAGSAFKEPAVTEFEAATRAMGGTMLSGWDKIAGEGAAAAANAASRMAGVMKLALSASLVGGALEVFRSVEIAIKNTVKLIETEFAQFGKVGVDAAHALIGGFTSVLEGKMPDVGRIIGAGLQGVEAGFQLPLNAVNAAIDSTIGRIPILGSMITSVTGVVQSALGGLFSAIQGYTGIAGEFANTILEIGNKWQEAARTIAGQTLGVENLKDYLGMVRDIAASGDLVHFKDVAAVVGELEQRLAGLSGGAGLTRQQVTQLATTLAEGNELLGDTKINVDNLTAAFNSFDVPAERTNQVLTEFINMARMTGADINELTRDIDTISPALQAMGFSAESAAMLMALVNQELGKPAMGRFSYSLAELPEKLAKSGLGVNDLVAVVRDYLALGDTVENRMKAIEAVQPFVGSAKAAENYVDMIRHGVIPTNEAMVEYMRTHGEGLSKPIDEALKVSKQFSDTLEQLSNQLQATLAPLGLGLVGKLNEAGEGISNWLQTHGVEFVGWVGKAGDKLLEWGGKIGHFLAEMMRDMSGAIEFFKNSVVVAVALVNKAFQDFSAPFAAMQQAGVWDPTGLIGAMAGIHQATEDAIPGLRTMLNFDLGKLFNEGAQAADAAAFKIEGMRDGLAHLVTTSQDALSLWQAGRATFGLPKPDPNDAAKFMTDTAGNIVREAPKLNDALMGSVDPNAFGAKGLSIDPAAWDAVVAQYHGKGINIVGDRLTGQIREVKANSQAELDDFVRYLNERYSPEQFAKLAAAGKVTFKVQLDTDAQHKSLQDWWKDNIGLPSELAQDVGPDGVLRPKIQPQVVPPELQSVLPELGGTPQPKPGPTPPPPTILKPHGLDTMKQIIEGLTTFTQLGNPLTAPLAPLTIFGGAIADLFQAGGTVSGPSGTDKVPIWATAGEKVMNLGASQRFGTILDWMNAQAFQAGGTVLDAAGIPQAMQGGQAGAIALPAAITLTTPDELGDADTLAKTGIPDKYQGDVQAAGQKITGVSIPTNLDTKTAESKSTEDVMTALGIPSNLQDSDGVKINVKLNLTSSPTMGVTSSTSSTTATSDTTSTTANFDNPGTVAAWGPHVQAALMRRGGVVGMKYGGQAGIPPEAYPAWYSAIMTQIGTESGGNPNIPASDPNDPNVKAGIPSVGLLQYIPSTYNTYNPTGKPYPDPDGQIAATLFYAPHDSRGYPAKGQTHSIGEGHGFQPGGQVLAPGQNPLAPGTGGYTLTEDYAIVQACLAEGVNPALWLGPMKTLIGRESGGRIWGRWDPTAVQHGYVDVNTGWNPAVGAAQVTPQTAAGVGIDPATLRDPINNIRASIRHIKDTYAGADAPGLGSGGLGKNMSALMAILNVQQADPMMPPMGYQPGGSVKLGEGEGGTDPWYYPHQPMYGQSIPGHIFEVFTGPSMAANNWRGGLIGMQHGGHGGRSGRPTLAEDKPLPAHPHFLGFQHGGSARTSLSYHHAASLAPHVGMPTSKSSVWTHMQQGGQPKKTNFLLGLLKGVLGELGVDLPTPGAGADSPTYTFSFATAGHMSALNSAVNVQGSSDLNTAGAQVDTIAVGRAVEKAFGITNMGFYRAPDGYNEHSSGEAVDVMISSAQQGNAVKDFVLANATALGVMYCLWQQKQWNPDGSTSAMADRGSPTANHMDHVHVRTHGGGYPPGGGPGKGGAGDMPAGTLATPAPGVRLGAQGGTYVTGTHWPGRDSVPMNVPAGTFIMNRHRSMQYRDVLDGMLGKGYAGGGMIPIIAEPGERIIPPGAAPPGLLHAMNQGRLLRRAVGGGTDDDQPVDATLPADTHVILIGRGSKTDPNLPQTPEPVGPFDPNAPGNALPPWAEKARVEPTAPGAIQTPYGFFQYATEANQWLGMTREEAKDFNEKLHQIAHATQQGADDQIKVNAANQAYIEAQGRLTAATDQRARLEAALPGAPGSPERQRQIAVKLGDKNSDLSQAVEEETKATTHLSETKRALDTANQTLAENSYQQGQAALQQPAWEKKAAEAGTTPDANAAALGAGLIKGMAQELGFGDVFGKPPWQWGIWKLFAGGASYALGIANRMGENLPGTQGIPAVGGQQPPGPFGPPTGPAPGPTPGAPGAPAPGTLPGAGTQTGTDEFGMPIYTMPDGTPDRADPDGGYLHKNGPDWVPKYNAKKELRWYPPGKGPAAPTPAQTGVGPAQSQDKLDGGYPGRQVQGGWEIFKDGKPTGKYTDENGNPIPGFPGGTTGATPAVTGIGPTTAPAPAAPGFGSAVAGAPGAPAQPAAPQRPYPTWDRDRQAYIDPQTGNVVQGGMNPSNPWAPVEQPATTSSGWTPTDGGTGIRLMSATTPMGGDVANLLGGMSWLMHPARSALEQYRSEHGYLPGMGPGEGIGAQMRDISARTGMPGPAAAATPAMVRSDTPAGGLARMKAGGAPDGGGNITTLNMPINNTGVMSHDEIGKTVTASLVTTSRYHPSMNHII